MARSSWMAVAIALAILVPWDRAGAVRIERRAASPGPGAAGTGAYRAARPRDTLGAARVTPAGPVRVVLARGPVGIVRGPDGVTRNFGVRGTGTRGSAGVERVGVQIGRTRRMLDLVQARADRCGSVEARDVVRRALEMQDRAESAENAGRHLAALQLTREARERGMTALRHCGHVGRVPEGVVSAIGRTDELLRVERERLDDSPAVRDERTRALERAAAAQQQARHEFRDGRLESSLRLTQEARRSLRSDADRGGDAGRGSEARRGGGREGPSRSDAARPEPVPRPRRR